MAGTGRLLSSFALRLLNNGVNRQLGFIRCRTLYTEESLGVLEYMNSRERYKQRYGKSQEAFKNKLRELLEIEKSMIFTDDLKALLHLAEKNPEDINLIKGALEKFNSQDQEIRFGEFKFGPVAMRCFHVLKEPDVALETFKNPAFEKFYDQQSTFGILVDLLYKNKMYKEVLEAYDLIRTNYPSGSKNPKLVMPVLMMACHELNTPESFRYALKVCKSMTERGIIPLRRVIAILAHLAIQQNSPDYALEVLAICLKPDFITIRTLKTMALCDLNRVDDVIRGFQDVLKRGFPEKNQYFSDIVEYVNNVALRLNLEPNSEIQELLEILKARNYINSGMLWDYISRPIDSTKTAKNGISNVAWAHPRRKADNWYGDSSNSQSDDTQAQSLGRRF